MIKNEEEFLATKKKITQELCDYVYFVLKWNKIKIMGQDLIEINKDLVKFLLKVSEIFYLIDLIIFFDTYGDYVGPDPFDDYLAAHCTSENEMKNKPNEFFYERLSKIFTKDFIKKSKNLIFDPKKSKIPIRYDDPYILCYDDCRMTSRKKISEIFIDEMTKKSEGIKILCEILVKIKTNSDIFYLVTLEGLSQKKCEK